MPEDLVGISMNSNPAPSLACWHASLISSAVAMCLLLPTSCRSFITS